MKFQTTLLYFLLLSTLSFAQQRDSFKQFKSQLQKQKSAKELVLTKALDYTHDHELYVDDLIDLCSYFPREKMKYKLCLEAYPRIRDKRNFFKVYDVFSSFAYAIKLYHHTQGKAVATPVHEPVVNYPKLKHYHGILNDHCKQPMSKFAFKALMNTASNAPNDQELFSDLKKLTDGNCFSTAQLMKLAQKIGLTSYRMSFLKFAFPGAIDVENYYYTLQLIDSDMEKQRLRLFIDEQIETYSTPEPVDTCHTPPSEFDYILKTIKDERFPKDKLNLAKKQLAKNCFNPSQLRLIIMEFSFDDDKLVLLKYSFDFVDYKDQFYKFRDLLRFINNKKDFDRFLLEHKQ